MLEEIREEPKALMRTYNFNKNLITEASDLISNASVIYITGSGTSFHASNFLSMLLMKAGVPAIPIQASNYTEFLVDKIPRNPINIIFSQSGESMDALSDLWLSKKKNIKVIGITNEDDSTLARESDLSIITQAGPEKSIAATKSHSVQMLTSLIIYSKMLGTDSERYLKDISDGIMGVFKTEKLIKDLAKQLNDHVVFLGSELDFPVAMEGDLKFKETSGINTESYPTREYLHGPIHRLDKDTSVVMLRGNGDRDTPVINKVAAIAGQLITIGSQNSSIEIPPFERVSRPVVFLSALQLMANYKSLAAGHDPDHPNNLTKVVRE